MTLTVRLVRIGFGVVTSILTARFLGPAGRGDYTLAVTVAALVVQFGTFGLQSSNTYLAAKDRQLYAGLVSNSLCAAALSIPLSAIVVVIESLTDSHTGTWLWWAAALAPASLFMLLGTNLLVGMGRIFAFNLFELVAAMLAVPLIVFAGLRGGGVGGILFASVATAWIVSVVLLAVLMHPHVQIRINFSVFRMGLGFAAKAYISALLSFLLLRANVFLLERLAGPAVLGQYSIAAQAVDVLAVLPASVALVLFPRLVTEQANRWSMVLRSAKTTAMLTVSVSIVVAALASPFIGVAFGPAFRPAVPMLLLLLPGTVLLAVTTILSQYLAARGFPLTLAGAWVVALVIGVLASLILIPIAGGVGASIGLSLAYSVLFVLVSILTIAERNRELLPTGAQQEPA